jgi:thiamine-monophosphate kinase
MWASPWARCASTSRPVGRPNMNEDELVQAIAAMRGGDGRVLVGIGDDAAVWQPSRSHRSVVTTDALVEGVHFSREWMSLDDVGWRAMASNLSDLAAMGARPRLGTVALGVPREYSRDDVLAVHRGLARCAQRFGLEIAGGDLVRAPVLTIGVTVIGEVRPSHLTLRSGARSGDVLATTGLLGASRAGLDLLRGTIVLSEDDARAALEAHRAPAPRVREGMWLAGSKHVHAMMDCSDGLSTDLGRMLRASGGGAVIEGVPVAPSARAAADANGVDPAAYALAGGEDYELIVAVHPGAFDHLSRRYAARFGSNLERLGCVRADGGLVAVKQGQEIPVVATGWDHFS